MALPGEIALARFPDPPGFVKLLSWVWRRKALLFAGWYLFVLLPALVLIVNAARVHELLGAAALVVGVALVAVAGLKLCRIFDGCRDLAVDNTTIGAAHLNVRSADDVRRISLRSGRITITEPGKRRGYGKAWLLGNPRPCLLLGDPRTGRLRDADDLRTLSAVLLESPQESDRAVGRQLGRLAAEAPAPSPPASMERAADLWFSLTSIGTVVAGLAVVATIFFAGGWVVESSAFVGPALLFGDVLLFGVWLFNALRQMAGLVAAIVRLVL